MCLMVMEWLWIEFYKIIGNSEWELGQEQLPMKIHWETNNQLMNQDQETTNTLSWTTSETNDVVGVHNLYSDEDSQGDNQRTSWLEGSKNTQALKASCPLTRGMRTRSRSQHQYLPQMWELLVGLGWRPMTGTVNLRLPNCSPNLSMTRSTTC